MSASSERSTGGDLQLVGEPGAGLGERIATVQGRLGPFVVGWVLPFALVTYLGLKGGGYDTIVRSEAGIAVWLAVIFGSLAGIFPLARLRRDALIGLGLLTGLAIWTAVAMLWTESAESTFEEAGRLITYLGVFVLALCLQGRGGLRRTLAAIAAALALIGGLALLSRLVPGWFPADQLAQAQSQAADRLNYPVNSWNGLASMIAIGLPLVLVFAVRGRHLATQAIATAAVPLLALVTYLTFSRTGLIAAALGLLLFLVLCPRRGHAIGVTAIAGAGALLAIAAASQREGVDGAVAAAAGDREEMLAIALIVCVGVALLRVALELADRHHLTPRIRAPRPPRWAWAAAVIVAGALAVAAGVPGEASEAWNEFKQPANTAVSAGRFDSASGNGRYQYWQAALDAGASAPIAGIGPGSWELWWAREATLDGYTRYAHSLYFETFAELGVVGLLLLLGFLAAIVRASIRALRDADPERRALFAAGLAAMLAFAFAAGVDWVWQLTVIPVAALFVAAALLAAAVRRTSAGDDGGGGDSRAPVTIGTVAAGIVAVGALTLTLLGAQGLRDGDNALAAGDQQLAIEEAESVRDLQPWALEPQLDRAVALEEAGSLAAASDAALAATKTEPTNWRPWYLLYEIEGERGRIIGNYHVRDGLTYVNDAGLEHFQTARAAYAKAQALHRRAPFLGTAPSHVSFEPVP